MAARDKIDKYVARWLAPYSPFSPLAYDEIEREMKDVAQELSVKDFEYLLDIYFTIQEEGMLIDYDQFMAHYIKHNSSHLARKLFKHLKPHGPWQIIRLIGYTKDEHLYPDLIKIIDYSSLDQEARFSLVAAFDFLKNKQAIEYLNKLKHIEPDAEILKEINLVIHNLKL